MQSRNEYIHAGIEKCDPVIRTKVEAYLYEVSVKGTRICNDGFPDARFMSTFKHIDARKVIARLRTEYDAQLFTVTVVKNYSLFGSK